MWIIYALASAFFAGLTSVLAKTGIKNTDSNLATALRTSVVLVFSWLSVFVAGSQTSLVNIDVRSVVFLVLSGLTAGGSWLCYFRALQLGDVNKVVPIDKSSAVLTMLLSFLLLGEELTPVKIIAMILIGTGTYLMVEQKETAESTVKGRKWLLYAVMSAAFASLTAISGKIGITGVESDLGTALRTVVILIMTWLIVYIRGKHRGIRQIDKRSRIYIGLSGLATGVSWMCFYRALREGPASVVVPTDKLSILITVAFGFFVFGEKLRKKALFGLIMIVAGTLSLPVA